MAIEDIARQLGNGLGETLAVHPSDAPHVRYATVAAVNSDGTLDVTVDGTTLRGVCATTGCVGARAGMRCVVLRQGPLATVVGLVASSSLGGIRLPNDGRIESTSAADPTDWHNIIAWIGDIIHIGNGTYNQQTGKTCVYGNEINLTSRGKINLNGNISDGWHYATRASIATDGSVQYMTFGNIAVVRVQDVKFGTTAPAMNDATICSGLPHANGSNFIFVLRPATNEALTMRVRITSAGLMQTHYLSTIATSTGRQWYGLAVYPYTR